MNTLYFWEMNLEKEEERNLKQVVSQGDSAKCPFCDHLNIMADEADTCDHLYEVILEEDGLYFYFYPEL